MILLQCEFIATLLKQYGMRYVLHKDTRDDTIDKQPWKEKS